MPPATRSRPLGDRRRATAGPGGALLALVAVIAAAGQAPGQPKAAGGANVNLAAARYALADFDGADEIAARVLEVAPDEFRAVLLRGQVALVGNRLGEAEQWLRRALELRPGHRDASAHLADVYLREARLPEAAALLAAIGETARAAALTALAGEPPYLTSAGGVTLELAAVDPFPVVLARVDESEPVAFVVDTGAAGVEIDAEWAAEIGLESLGLSRPGPRGPADATVAHAVVRWIQLRGLGVRNVPVVLRDTSDYERRLPGHPVRGVLGAALLERFRVTFDFPRRELRLEPRRGVAAAEAVDDEPTSDGRSGEIRLPFWLGPRHTILARGRANDSDPRLFAVETGLAGVAFACGESMVDEAAIELPIEPFRVPRRPTAPPVQPAGPPVGPQGPPSRTPAAASPRPGPELPNVPFLLRRLSLGGAERRDVPGVVGRFPEGLEHGLGFRVAGSVAHGFLRPWVVTFDFDAMEIVVSEPAGGSATGDATRRGAAGAP